MKIILIIEDTDNNMVNIQSQRQNSDGSAPDPAEKTPANNIAIAMEQQIMNALSKGAMDMQEAARCWH